MKSLIRIGLTLGALMVAQAASALPLTYNFEATSNVFRTTNCRMTSDLDLNGNGVRDTLRLCGDGYPVTGFIAGDWDGTRLTNLSGNIDGFAITGGSLGGDFYTATMQPLWTIVTARWGTFVFERLGGFNQITADSLQLWGQNLAAYGIRQLCQIPGRVGLNTCTTKGVELYAGGRIAVPEPAAIAILLAALAGGAVALRRRPGRRAIAAAA